MLEDIGNILLRFLYISITLTFIFQKYLRKKCVFRDVLAELTLLAVFLLMITAHLSMQRNTNKIDEILTKLETLEHDIYEVGDIPQPK